MLDSVEMENELASQALRLVSRSEFVTLMGGNRRAINNLERELWSHVDRVAKLQMMGEVK